uniref:Uncharacterized protein n=1 Tax=Amphimedon queenslandica TaxID=400682 RepID=A0A1X7TAE2_AMPQE
MAHSSNHSKTDDGDSKSDTIDENKLQHLGLSLNSPVDTTEPSTGSHARHLLNTRECTTQDTGSPSYNTIKDGCFTAQVSQKQSEKRPDKRETKGVASNVKFEASVTSPNVSATFTPLHPTLDIPLSQYAKSVVYK